MTINMSPEEFWSILHDVPTPEPLFYRLYYSDHGQVLFYTMEAATGNYIEIDQETFSRSPSNVRVVNCKLTYIDSTKQTSKLVPSTEGTCCSITDVSIVVSAEVLHSKWKLKTYE